MNKPATNKNPFPYVFFGSATFSIYVLEELEKAGMSPSLIVTTPDKPAGRGLAMTPTPVKAWGLKRGIPILDPTKLDATFIETLKNSLPQKQENLCFIVAAYGKIIPQTVLDIPARATLNVHPSLLPRYRGAAPLQSAMLDDTKNTGVTIMRIDAVMDHGPIVAQKEIIVNEWPTYEIFEEMMAREGGRLLAETIPGWIAGTMKEKEQDHTAATFTKKITKEDGLIDFPFPSGKENKESEEKAYEIFRKIQAYHEWPTAYFFIKKNGKSDQESKKIRVKITQASWHDGRLIIEKVIPEGKKETDFASFIKNI